MESFRHPTLKEINEHDVFGEFYEAAFKNWAEGCELIASANKEKVWLEICNRSPVYFLTRFGYIDTLSIPYQLLPEEYAYLGNGFPNSMSALAILDWTHKDSTNKRNIKIFEALIDVFGIKKVIILPSNDRYIGGKT